MSKELGVGHAEHVAPMFDRLLAEAGVGASSVARMGVTVGPGSFMGQRVGIAFAKGIALGTGAATVPLNTLHAIAASVGYPLAVIVDARRGEVYVQAFGPKGEPLAPPSLLPIGEATKWAEAHPGPAAGSGVHLAAPGRARDATHYPSPEGLMKLTTAGEPGPLRTLYLRAPDAKPPTKPPF